MRRICLGFFVLAQLVGFAANFTFYTSESAFNAAIAGLEQQTITFDSLATGDYQPLTIQGVSFTGNGEPSGSSVAIFDQATWTLPFFGSSTGNSLAVISDIDATLPGGTTALGFLVGSSAASVLQVSSQEDLIVGTEGSDVIVTPANPFRFIGLVSDEPISSVDIHSLTSFLTIDNFTFAGASVPEPSTALLFAIPLAAFAIRRRLQR